MADSDVLKYVASIMVGLAASRATQDAAAQKARQDEIDAVNAKHDALDKEVSDFRALEDAALAKISATFQGNADALAGATDAPATTVTVEGVNTLPSGGIVVQPTDAPAVAVDAAPAAATAASDPTTAAA